VIGGGTVLNVVQWTRLIRTSSRLIGGQYSARRSERDAPHRRNGRADQRRDPADRHRRPRRAGDPGEIDQVAEDLKAGWVVENGKQLTAAEQAQRAWASAASANVG
jgi:hypothetical protein